MQSKESSYRIYHKLAETVPNNKINFWEALRLPGMYTCIFIYSRCTVYTSKITKIKNTYTYYKQIFII